MNEPLLAPRPDAVTAADFDRALNRLQSLLGDGLVTDAPTVRGFRDPFAYRDWDAFAPSAVVMPASVEEVQGVLRIANEYRLPLWTSSQGRNNGYGGAAPRTRGGLVLSLRRMNRVLEVDEDSAWALVEPGVRFFDLHEHLRSTGSSLWMSVPDLGWGSVVGNTLDHGLGYTPTGDHPANQCGMEVVLPDGDVLRTGMGGLPGSRAWQVYRRGCGPGLDGLFMQSNLGIVTKMGLWLMPAPECYMPGWLTLRRDEDLELLLERLRPLMIDGTIANQPMIINAVCAASAFSGREDWYTGAGPIPNEVIERIAGQPGLGRWVMRFALYGDERIVERQREIVTAALGSIPGAGLSFSKYDGRHLPELHNPHERVQAGIPSMDLNRMTSWYGGTDGGHIGFSCAAPITGRDGAALRQLVGGALNAAGLDYSGVFVVGRRSMIHVGLVVFDTSDEAQTRTAYETCRSLVAPAAALGYGEYRAHLDFMDLVADQYSFNGHAQRRFCERLKDTLDPNGILSPGKQGHLAARDARSGPVVSVERTADVASLRRLTAGAVVGSREAGDLHAWRGIPYAAPPLGPLRWRAPRPPAPWDGTRPALQHGAMAPQFAGLLAPVPPALHGRIVGDEDCLSLNVFAPAWSPQTVPTGRDRRPVMVWIHGGGNAVGTSASYDVARQLARQHGVIVVTVNYRLGVLGWFTHPALQAQQGVSAEERSGNFGLLDLIAALRWVRDEIPAFGGDPGRVTIFGESAGGQNVLLLLAGPLAAGLFHRAIAQSPVCESFGLDEAIDGLDSPLDSRRCGSRVIGARLHEAAGRRPAAPGGPAAEDEAGFLRSLSAAELLAAHRPGSVGIYLTPRPTRDGVVLPLRPLLDVFALGEFNRVPVILGSNRDEYRTFLADKPEHSRLLFGKLPILRDRQAYLAESSALSRAWRAHHVDAPADAMLASGHADVWTYRFDWDEAPAIPFVRPDLLLGAAHAMEMAFAFGDTDGEFDPFKVNTPFNRGGRLALARAMSTAWATMARDGEPSLPSAPAWTRRLATGAADSLVFDTAAGGGLRMARARESLAAIRRELRDGGGAVADALAPQAYARVFLWSPLFAGQADPDDYARVCARVGHDQPASVHRPQVEI